MQGGLQSIESCRPSEAQGIPVAGRWVAGNPPRREIQLNSSHFFVALPSSTLVQGPPSVETSLLRKRFHRMM